MPVRVVGWDEVTSWGNRFWKEIFVWSPGGEGRVCERLEQVGLQQR